MKKLRSITRDRMIQDAEDEIENLILGGIDVGRMYRKTPDGPVSDSLNKTLRRSIWK